MGQKNVRVSTFGGSTSHLHMMYVGTCIVTCIVCVSIPPAEKKEKVSDQKKAHKVYEKLSEEEEACKSKLASCETRDVRARQVSTERERERERRRLLTAN